MDTPPEYLFVYGSLRAATGAPAHRLLENQVEFIGMGAFQGRLYDLGSYPGVVPSSNPADRVLGETYSLLNPERTLPVLDAYEGVDYRRKKRIVLLETGDRLQAWIYIYISPVEGKKRIRSGDYLNPE